MMALLEAHEAQLFRLLVAFFGEDRVIPFMSVHAVCGGEVPEKLSSDVRSDIQRLSQRSPKEWARASKCLFTIVNHADSPCLVVEFFEAFDRVIDVLELTRRRFIEPVLSSAGVHYVTISIDELHEIMDPETNYGLADFLDARLELPEHAVQD